MKRIGDLDEARARFTSLRDPSGVACRECGADLPRYRAGQGLCDACGEKSYAAEYAQRRAEAQASRLANMEPVLAQAWMPLRYRGCTRETWRGSWPATLDRWAAEADLAQRGNLLISGSAGTGKSHLAAALLHEHLRPLDAAGLWINAGEMLELLRREFDDHAAEGRTMKALVGAPLLVLDDLGAEMLAGERGEWRRDRISYLVQRRWDECRPTVITTNLEPKQVTEGEPRLGSRICAGETLITGGRDRRRARP